LHISEENISNPKIEKIIDKTSWGIYNPQPKLVDFIISKYDLKK